MADTNGFAGTAWSIDGAEHPASLLRLAAYAFSSGAEGIIGPDDLKVQELDIPSSQIRMNAGAAEFLNRSLGSGKQTYIVQAPGESRLDVAPNNSTTTTRYDLVCVRVEDPEFALPAGVTGPPTEEDAVNWQYVRPFIRQNVPASTRRWSQLNETYSAYAVALLVIPPQTGTITDDMIIDLRRVARPQREPYQFDAVPTAAQDLVSAPWNPWATAADRQVPVPTWATKAIIRADLGGVRVAAGSIWGKLRARLGAATDPATVITREVGYDETVPAGTGSDRKSYMLGSTVDVPAALRGQTVYFGIEGKADGGASPLRVDELSVILTSIEFLETAA